VDLPRYRLAPPYGIRPIVIGLTALAIAGLAAIAWLAFEPVEPASTRAIAPADALALHSRNAAAAIPVPPAAVVTPSGEPDPGLVEVCGVGWVEVAPEANALDPAVFAQVAGIEASGNAILAGLRESSDGFDRATAILLEMHDTRTGSAEPARLEQLAQQAVTSDDPRVYALAYRACLKSPEQGSCARLSAAQWARLDASNAAPWLFVLDEAAARNDQPLVDEALYRIGSGARYEDRPFASAAAIVARAGASDSDLVAAHALVTQSLGIAAALTAPLQRFMRTCAGSALADANRRQACDAAAATIGERSDSALISMIGAAVGRRLGWPIDRIVAIHAEMAALSELSSSDPGADPRFGASYSCAGMRRALDRIRQIARVGEPQMARAWMAASGKPYERYASAAREREAKRSASDGEENSRRLAAAPVERAASVPE
jgi:hypothetical protein